MAREVTNNESEALLKVETGYKALIRVVVLVADASRAALESESSEGVVGRGRISNSDMTKMYDALEFALPSMMHAVRLVAGGHEFVNELSRDWLDAFFPPLVDSLTAAEAGGVASVLMGQYWRLVVWLMVEPRGEFVEQGSAGFEAGMRSLMAALPVLHADAGGRQAFEHMVSCVANGIVMTRSWIGYDYQALGDDLLNATFNECDVMIPMVAYEGLMEMDEVALLRELQVRYAALCDDGMLTGVSSDTLYDAANLAIYVSERLGQFEVGAAFLVMAAVRALPSAADSINIALSNLDPDGHLTVTEGAKVQFEVATSAWLVELEATVTSGVARGVPSLADMAARVLLLDAELLQDAIIDGRVPDEVVAQVLHSADTELTGGREKPASLMRAETIAMRIASVPFRMFLGAAEARSARSKMLAIALKLPLELIGAELLESLAMVISTWCLDADDGSDVVPLYAKACAACVRVTETKLEGFVMHLRALELTMALSGSVGESTVEPSPGVMTYLEKFVWGESRTIDVGMRALCGALSDLTRAADMDPGLVPPFELLTLMTKLGELLHPGAGMVGSEWAAFSPLGSMGVFATMGDLALTTHPMPREAICGLMWAVGDCRRALELLVKVSIRPAVVEALGPMRASAHDATLETMEGFSSLATSVLQSLSCVEMMGEVQISHFMSDVSAAVMATIEYLRSEACGFPLSLPDEPLQVLCALGDAAATGQSIPNDVKAATVEMLAVVLQSRDLSQTASELVPWALEMLQREG
ncbi:uncharacterized protein AMSG_01904 [Thecamonas trahens ATCC 50062]|uniref:Uncharacterized protein n=1 Tax=Thecamonas trahens ATCC 50062 TaxID=461836 RepID=A0A0L0DTR0_THETB|nr:hypothetical protein AMSG_01904 [Thecamonas trahens ATCC 50062]KNC55635.1 hypothetical protein AMSG_01904 [Thecamonas trahens ATCC 50062]|eukprot:XP_013761405.1 hypothetical protein AMSG_01904 [Thecamonas trahens ATCC 50062]